MGYFMDRIFDLGAVKYKRFSKAANGGRAELAS